MVKLRFLIKILIIILIEGCGEKLGGFQELTIYRKNYNGTELRTDGYYYSFTKKDNLELGSLIFLYKNGILLYAGSEFTTSIKRLDQIANLSVSCPPKGRQVWGVFDIQSDSIKFERWLLNSNGKIPTGYSRGEIINDSTFSIDFFTNKSRWQFRQFTNKPDSSNALLYIK